MKVIENIELLKKLTPVLEDIETEYIIFLQKDEEPIISRCNYYDLSKSLLEWEILLKTLTTDELFSVIWKWICHFEMPYPNAWQLNWGLVIWDESIDAEDLNEYFVKCLEYLIDNNLLKWD